MVKNRCPWSSPEGSVKAIAPPSRLYSTIKLYMARWALPGLSQGTIRHIYMGTLHNWNGNSPQWYVLSAIT